MSARTTLIESGVSKEKSSQILTFDILRIFPILKSVYPHFHNPKIFFLTQFGVFNEINIV
ncbi:hypothetical protein MASR2M39_00520 [Ignavibacteriales bacterium]